MASGPSLRGVAARAARTARRHWRPLLVIGAVIFIPLGLLEVVDEHVGEVDYDELSEAAEWGLVGVGFMAILTAMLGEIFFAGVVAAAVSETHGGQAPSFGELVRSLPYLTLIAIDLLFALGLAVTLLLLIVPGILFFGWFGITAPVAKIEHLGVRAAFRRSRELVRGHLRLALLALVPVAIAGQLLSTGIALGLEALIGEAFGAEWLGATLTEFVATPIWAFAAVALTYELLEHGAGAEPDRATSP